MVHRIRLRHPWTLEHSTRSDLASRSDLGSHDTSSGDVSENATSPSHQITFTRRFNRPTGLTAEDRLGIEVIDPAGQLVSIELNNRTLRFDSTAEPICVDLGDTIEDHNELRIVLRRDDSSPELGEVNLRIESVD